MMGKEKEWSDRMRRKGTVCLELKNKKLIGRQKAIWTHEEKEQCDLIIKEWSDLWRKRNNLIDKKVEPSDWIRKNRDLIGL